jgi:hypothetical protein
MTTQLEALHHHGILRFGSPGGTACTRPSMNAGMPGRAISR